MIGRNIPRPNVPAAAPLQWANGKTIARPQGSDDDFAFFVGFHIEVGKDPELDARLSAAGMPQVEIEHQRKNGSQIATHWSLGKAIDLLPITSGPVASSVSDSCANGAAAETADAGIALRWGRGERSQLAIRGFVRSIWEAGYNLPVQLVISSRMTDRLLAALLDHTRAATAADEAVDRKFHPDTISPAELWLPLGPGARAEFGRYKTAMVTPIVSKHPEELTIEYLRSIWRPADVWAATTAAWSSVQEWARQFQVATGDGLAPEDR